MRAPIAPAITESLVKQLAVASISGIHTTAALAKQFNLPRHTVTKIVNSPEYAIEMGKMTDEIVMPSVIRARTQIAKLADKAVKVLEKHLDEDNLDGVKIVLKVMGLDAKAEEKQADTNIQVILPSTSHIKDVKAEIIEE